MKQRNFILGVLSLFTYLTFFFNNQSWRKIPAPSSDHLVFQKIQDDLPNLPLSYWQHNKEAIHVEYLILADLLPAKVIFKTEHWSILNAELKKSWTMFLTATRCPISWISSTTTTTGRSRRPSTARSTSTRLTWISGKSFYNSFSCNSSTSHHPTPFLPSSFVQLLTLS